MDKLTIEVGATVRHFKRKEWLQSASEEFKREEPNMYLYRIEGLAYNTLTGKIDVVYRGLYESCTLYTRSLEDFLRKIDEGEYGQGFAFVEYLGDIKE